MGYVDLILEKFGGTRPMAAAIGKPVSTVQSWKDRGSIPDVNKPIVLDRAKALGLPLDESDFFPTGLARSALADVETEIAKAS